MCESQRKNNHSYHTTANSLDWEAIRGGKKTILNLQWNHVPVFYMG